MHGKELCVKLVIYKDCTEMLHGQQNVKDDYFVFCVCEVVMKYGSHAYGVFPW